MRVGVDPGLGMTNLVSSADAAKVAGLGVKNLALVGDIGGTNARYALVDLHGDACEILAPRGYRCSAYVEATDSIRAYLHDVGLNHAPGAAAIAVAGPVKDGAIRFTNMSWTLSENGLRSMGFSRAKLLNDYAALALAAPKLKPVELHQLGGAAADHRQTIAVLGPGTGFGASALARDGIHQVALATEGGHIAFAPCDDVEIEILKVLTWRFGRVSVERLLSGPGLCNIHSALAEIEGRADEGECDPAEITRRALAGDAASRAAVDRFCAILGSVAGDMALNFGAQGGVYIGGGICPQILDILVHSPFRERFEDKGRFRQYLEPIPAYVILREFAALVGAAQAPRLLMPA